MSKSEWVIAIIGTVTWLLSTYAWLFVEPAWVNTVLSLLYAVLGVLLAGYFWAFLRVRRRASS